MRMKSIFYILLSVLLFSCSGKKEYQDNIFHKFLTLKTPVATTNPAGQYTVDYVFEYDSSSLELKAELIPSGDSVLPTFSSVTKSGTLNFNLSDPSDSINFLVKIIEGAHQGDYSVVLTNIISKYKDSTLPKNIVLDDRVLKGKDEWNIDYTKDLYDPYFKYNIPLEVWLLWVIYGVGSCLLLFVLFVILKMDNMPLGKQTFENGRISFNNPQLDMVRLADRQEFNLGKYLTGTVDIDLKLTHKKVKHKKKEIKVARLSFSDPNIRIKIIHFDGEEMASSGYQLFNNDDLMITLKIDNENKNFNITYFNTKNRR